MKAVPVSRLERPWWCLMGLLMVWAGVSKILQPIDFLGSLYAFKLPIPGAGLRIIALALPWFELLMGVLLLLGLLRETMQPACTGLLLVFALATGQAWIRELELACGCFEIGFLPAQVSAFMESAGFSFVRNLFLSIVSGFFVLRSTLPHPLARAKSGLHGEESH